MYRDEDQFVLGQKIKLIVCSILLALACASSWLAGRGWFGWWR